MTIVEPQSPATRGLIARIKGILRTPEAEWAVIDAEPATIRSVFVGYVVPLAAIPPVCHAIGETVFGHGAFWFRFRPSLASTLSSAISAYLLSLVGLFVLALIIEALAPMFGGVKDRLKAVHVAAYAYTAVWVIGVVGLLPPLMALGILGGLYSLYLLYKGLPRLMKVEADKAVPYMVSVFVAALVLYVVIATVVASIAVATVATGIGMMANHPGQLSGQVTVGDAQVDLGKLQAASKQMEAAVKGQTVEGAVPALPGETLKGLLPAGIGGFIRTEVESASGGAGGLQGSNAQGVYVRGDGRITLEITDMAAAGGLAGLAGAFKVNARKETATGYETVTTEGGRMTTESYERPSRSGKYAVMVANRFMVEADGSGVTMEELKAAVAAVGLPRLEGLAKG